MIRKTLKILAILSLLTTIVFAVAWFVLKDQLYVMKAVLEEDKATISYYIDEKGFDPNDLYGWFNLYHLYFTDKRHNADRDFVEFMLQKGVSPKHLNDNKVIILSYLIALGKEDFVELFIQYGDDVNALNYGGTTPLGISLSLYNCEISRLLIDNGATIDRDAAKDKLHSRLEECAANNWISTQKMTLD